VCAEFDADNFDRVTAGAGLGRVTEYQAECKYDEPFTKEMEWTQSRTCRHTKLATLLLTLKVS
jgi:hypothetical protein